MSAQKNNKTRQSAEKRRRMRIIRQYRSAVIRLFFGVLMLLALIGLILPLRPKVSAIEKRELEKWPHFSLASIWDGSYFSQISTWYADTYPFREKLISADSRVKSLYGLRGDQIVYNGAKVADEIPEDGMMRPAETKDAEEVQETGETTTRQPETQKETEKKDPNGKAINAVPEPVGDVYVTGDTAFSLYYFALEGANEYISDVDMIQKKLDGIATVYDILAPSSVGIMLTDQAQEKLGVSSQKEAISYAFSNIEKLNKKVKCINVCQNLVDHNSEYIYFRTDHHWTALGAYYAYEEFCKAKGIKPTPISEYEKVEFPDFLGTLYAGSGQASALGDHPDTVVAYIPKATNDMKFIGHDGLEYDWNVVEDVTDWEAETKYNCFVGGDEPFGVIENPDKTDGSACVVVKESYGNAFIPFLVDNYQYTYIVDHRYFAIYEKYGNDFVKMVKDKNIQDVILLNTTVALCDTSLSSTMAGMFE